MMGHYFQWSQQGWWEPFIMGTAGVQIRGNSAQGWWEPLIMGTAGVQTRELSTGMVGTPHNGHSRCTDPGNSAQGWWEPLIMGTAWRTPDLISIDNNNPSLMHQRYK
ncbi:unnamed protein product [Staurois parvus]|uniref:Uncharacterized protein n=1 Tax=Staurois parvus TaxID=386267 RepID=A0ABN9CYM5_9NEOB|nr:unnamed protein product [Staurois parvus]